MNFKTGGDVNDFMHGWLNYQIEHHMFSDMSMLTYQKMAPEMKLLCEKCAPISLAPQTPPHPRNPVPNPPFHTPYSKLQTPHHKPTPYTPNPKS